MNLRRSIGTVAALIVLVAAWRGTGADVVPEPIPARHAPAQPAPVKLAVQGAGSCSATACHGSTIPAARDEYPSRVLRNEHTTWITQDRHADAYRVLFSRRSQDMAARLTGGKIAAHQYERCLVCHATGGVGPTAVAPEVVRQDGISCESCHGPAQLWLAEHTRYGWHDRSPEQKEQLGMHSTRELPQRAAVCVACHVGTPGRDMNHDLIAAGHPRLNFEFAAYLANMPPHWVEDMTGNFPARVWAIGQAATAKAAADLLAHRAANPAVAPWPEFSEYDCFACHHELANEEWRQKRPPEGRAPGTPAWGTWYYPEALALAHKDSQTELGERFAALRGEMNHFGADPARAAAAAQQVSAALGHWLQTLPAEARGYDAPKVKALIETVRAKDAPGPSEGWDGAAQRYLALQPLRLTVKELDRSWADAPVEAEVKSLFQSLQFPRGYDSPRHFVPTLPFGSR